MKEKIENTKGITLVALIITIIVLLILAVVAITSISNSNIIKHAQNGRDAYDLAKENEQGTLAEYEQYLDNNNPLKTSAEVEWGCYKNTEEDETILVYLGTNDKVTIKSTDKILAYIGDFDDDDNFVPTTKTETIELASLKNSERSEIQLKYSKSIKELTIDKEIENVEENGESINCNFPKNMIVLRYLEGREVLGNLDSFQLLETVYLPSTIKEITQDCFRNCGNNTANEKITIIYNGTKEQWNQIIIKSTYMSDIIVKCTDGDLTISN